MKNKGFSLTEIMVVVVIIGILASIITINLTSAKVKGRDAKRQSDMDGMASSLEIYYAQNKTYPIASNWDVLKDYTDLGGKKFYPTYISSWPVDPKNETANFPKSFAYYYKITDDGSMFALDAMLEGNKDCDSSIELTDSTKKDDFFKAGIVCGNNGKNHYRVVGR